MRAAWGFPDPPELSRKDVFQAHYRGKRYSFGYPACPDLESQALLFRLLRPEEIGVELTEGFMMEPGGVGVGAGVPPPGCGVLFCGPGDGRRAGVTSLRAYTEIRIVPEAEWSIVLYVEGTYSPVAEFIASLDDKAQDRITWSLEQLRIRNVRAHEPLVKHIEGKLWELREASRGNIYRVFYFFAVRRQDRPPTRVPEEVTEDATQGSRTRNDAHGQIHRSGEASAMTRSLKRNHAAP